MGSKKRDNPRGVTLHGRLGKVETRLSIVETDVKWLKKGYWIQALFGVATFISVLGLILKLTGV